MTDRRKSAPFKKARAFPIKDTEEYVYIYSNTSPVCIGDGEEYVYYALTDEQQILCVLFELFPEETKKEIIDELVYKNIQNNENKEYD